MQGVLRFWNREKGFGFAAPPNPRDRDVFIHASDVNPDDLPLQDGDVVEFEMGSGPTGRPCAKHVRVLYQEL
jgi:cold shock CspA family protein